MIIGAPSTGRHPSDSDVRLVPDMLKGASDSDVQLASPDSQAAQRFRRHLIKEDTADHGIIGSGSSDTSVRVSPFRVRRRKFPRPHRRTAISSSIPRAS